MVIPLALIAGVTVLDVLAPTEDFDPTPVLIAAPAITLTFAGSQLTALIGALSVISQVVSDGVSGQLTVGHHQVELAALTGITLLLVFLCRQRERRARELNQVRRVSTATQQVVLRPLPHQMGSLRLASLYLAAEEEAQVGGDLYAATRTADGGRLIIGDVRGKGLTAISDASMLMGAFRETAPRCGTLLQLAIALEESIRRHLDEQLLQTPLPESGDELHEQFVTALMLDIPDEDHHMAHLANNGHPPPLLLHKNRVTTLWPRHYHPPLGLRELARGGFSVEAFAFEDDDTLLLYTDGVIEARDADGSFYPLTQRVAEWTDSDPEALLHHINEDLVQYVGGRLRDDAAVVAVQRAPLGLPAGRPPSSRAPRL